MRMPLGPAGTWSYTIRPGDSLQQVAQRFRTTAQAILSANPAINENNLQAGQTIRIPRGYNPPQAPAQAPPKTPPQASAQPMPGSISKAEETLNNRMRLLWEQHVYWTRMVILSMAFDLPDTELVTARLLRNPKDFEAALKPFYGAETAAKFAALFTDHLTIAAELVQAAKAGDSAAAADAEKRWYANADQIAAFLAGINPYWSEQEWQKMLYDHLAMTKTEAVDILTQKYADSIRIFERIEQEALMMADVMTQGLVRQFPQNFR